MTSPINATYYVYVAYNGPAYPNGALVSINDRPVPDGTYANDISVRVMTGQEILDTPRLGWRTFEGERMMRQHGILPPEEERKPETLKPCQRCGRKNGALILSSFSGLVCRNCYDEE